ncbi:putative WRKY transcription factor 51 [Cocos nucifera]|uniref:Putative WRKY transcription factor 51 n=1 Tax=Cocos nucifera TaxID=13894 RepID=A0A8K0NBJ8_COCNU|nr:putative WRKY transcription factor 51 [Cocos nucifera]
MEEESRDLVSEIAGDPSWTFSGDGGFIYCTERDDSILGDIAPEVGSGFLAFDLGDASGSDMVAPPPEKRSPPPPPAPTPKSGAGSGGTALSSSTGDPPETT